MAQAPANKIGMCLNCRIEGYFEGTQCVSCALFAWQVDHSFTGQQDQIIPQMLLAKLGSLLFEMENFVCKHGLVKICRRLPKRDEGARRGDHLVNHWLLVNTREEKFLDDTVSKQPDEICFGETNWGAKEPHMYFKCTRVLAYEARRILTDYIKWQEANTDSTNISCSSGTVSNTVSNYEAKLQIPKKGMETKPIQKATRAAEPVINAYSIVADSRKSDTGETDQLDTAPAPLVKMKAEPQSRLAESIAAKGNDASVMVLNSSGAAASTVATDSCGVASVSATIVIKSASTASTAIVPHHSDPRSPPEKDHRKKAKIMDVEDITAECDPLMQQAIYLSSSSKVQEALNSLANAFNICVTKARTLENLQEWINLDERLDQEENFICKHLMDIIQQGFVPLEALTGFSSGLGVRVNADFCFLAVICFAIKMQCSRLFTNDGFIFLDEFVHPVASSPFPRAFECPSPDIVFEQIVIFQKQ